MMSPPTRCNASAARAANMRRWSPIYWACRGSSFIPSPACCPRTAWGLADQIAMREAALEHELNPQGLSAAAALAARLLDEAAAELKAQGLGR